MVGQKANWRIKIVYSKINKSLKYKENVIEYMIMGQIYLNFTVRFLICMFCSYIYIITWYIQISSDIHIFYHNCEVKCFLPDLPMMTSE